MINVLMYKKDEWIYRIKVSGHAGYDISGSDIVCSAVSVLVINTINAIEKFTDTKLIVKQTDGEVEFEITTYEEKSALLIKTLELGIKSIVTEYGKYVKLSYRR